MTPTKAAMIAFCEENADFRHKIVTRVERTRFKKDCDCARNEMTMFRAIANELRKHATGGNDGRRNG